MRIARKRVRAGLLPALAALLCGCGEAQPSGQVLASVGGQDITRSELRHEIEAANVQLQRSDREAVNELVERIVDRKLLAAEAERRGLDRDPDFHFSARRTREMLLVEALRASLERKIADPTPQQIKRLMTDREWMFAKRRKLVLRDVATGQQIAIDTASFGLAPPPWDGAAGKGETVEFDGRSWTIESAKPVDLTRNEQAMLATTILKEQSLASATERALEASRNNAVIKYQSGWGPGAR